MLMGDHDMEQNAWDVLKYKTEISRLRAELDQARSEAMQAEEMQREFADALGREQDRNTRLERELVLARSESVLAVVDRFRETMDEMKARFAARVERIRKG